MSDENAVEELARSEEAVTFHPLKLTREDEKAISDGYLVEVSMPTLLFASIGSTEMVNLSNGSGGKIKTQKREYMRLPIIY